MDTLDSTAWRSVTLLGLLLLVACGGSSGTAVTVTPPPVDVSGVAVGDVRSSLPATWSQGAFMEIYVRGYKDSDGDGIGDLKGLTHSLDYLQDLGITGLWLMPVTDSQDQDHGYAVKNYRDIERTYGTLSDFDNLLKEAHARGIGVIIDYVINHSAYDNPVFTNSRAGTDNTYRNWYVWQSPAPSGWQIYGTNPWYSTGSGSYFAGFWSQMPEWNLRQPPVLSYHLDSMRFWLNRGVDGFRFDAVGNLIENGPQAWENQPENDGIMNAVRQMVMGYNNRYMVCESPGAPQSYGFEDSCGGSFAFAHQSNIVGAASGDTSSITDVSQYYGSAPKGMATFVSNHDAFAGQRLWDQLSGDTLQYRLAAATNLLLSNAPFIYYGEEIGMAGGASLSGDHKLRTPMSWTDNASNAGFTTAVPFRALSANVKTNNAASQVGVASSLHSFYKDVIALRKSRSSLMAGNYVGAKADAQLMSYRRRLGTEQTLVVFNYGKTDATAQVSGLPINASLRRLWPQASVSLAADSSGSASVAMPRQSFAVFSVGTAP